MAYLQRLIFVLSLSFISINSHAQYSGLDLLNDKDKLELKFEFTNGFAILKVIYAGIIPLDFLIDTGASHNILFKKNINDILGISYTDTIIIGGAELNVNLKAMVARNIPISLINSGVINRDIIVLEEDYLDLEKLLGRKIDGILGGDFFKGLVVDLNYKRGVLKLHNPEKFEPHKKFTEHDISMIGYKPYLKCKTKIEDQTDTLNYLLDTGASLALLIHSNLIENFKIPENVVIGSLGKGLGGNIHGFIGMSNQLNIDNYEINNVISSFQKIDSTVFIDRTIVREGIIGNTILSRFHVVIDYVNEKLYLKPTRKLSDEFEFDKSGMLIYALGPKLNQYYVKDVYPNTPADKAGIKPGDKILKIGKWPIIFYDMNKIISKLQGKDNTKICLKILRDQKELYIEFRLKDFFKSQKNKI